MCGAPYTVCLLIAVAKPETSHVLQSNKNKTYQCPFHLLVTLWTWISVVEGGIAGYHLCVEVPR